MLYYCIYLYLYLYIHVIHIIVKLKTWLHVEILLLDTEWKTLETSECT